MSAQPKMIYVNLGSSGLKVSKLILGCMQYGSAVDWMIPDHDEGIRQLKYAYDIGINAFDTANVYSNGESEIILGKFLKQHKIPRESVVILTKTYGAELKVEDAGPAGLVNQEGLSRKRIIASVKNSLERLGLEYIDVLQCHRFDPNTPIAETMKALHYVVERGWVRYVGMSSCWAYQFQLMQQYALQHDLTPFISMQNQHSAVYREEEREMMPTLKHFGVGAIPWAPLAAGYLCRPAEDISKTVRGEFEAREYGLGSYTSDVAVNKAVAAVAKAHSVSMAEVAIAWSVHSPWVTAPIVGVRSTERLDELVKGIHLKLSDEDIAKISDVYVPTASRSFS